jgi:heterotetrameric sarcosine oxidase gamma subunit
MVSTPLIAQLTEPLSGTEPIFRPDLQVQALPQRSVFDLRGDGRYAGQSLPDRPGTCGDLGDWRALRLRPDGWLLIGAAPQDALRLTDLSHSFVCICLKGTAMRKLLALGTPFDLRPDRFGPDRCARTWGAGFTLILDHRSDAIDVYIDTSSAVAFWAWLTDAAAGLVP